jgi:sec-independent protein translocase protein TatA
LEKIRVVGEEFMRLGWPEIALIVVIILIVFGVGRLPQVGGAIGRGIRAFRRAQTGEDEEEEKTKVIKEPEKGSSKNEGTT